MRTFDILRVMAFGLKRTDLQGMAEAKLRDAEFLLSDKRFSSAYYLAGYAAEISLKACIARRMEANTIPNRQFVNAIYQHDLRNLLNLAGLLQELKARETADPEFAAFWAIITEWNPEIRYAAVDAYSAQTLIQALIDNKSGFFPWIKAYW